MGIKTSLKAGPFKPKCAACSVQEQRQIWVRR